MRKNGLVCVLLVAVALLAASCATTKLTIKNPDGSLNIPLLLTWAQDGIDADCAIMPGSPVCTLGTDAIALARSKGKDVGAIRQTLVDAAAQFPVIAPYVRFVVDLLGALPVGTAAGQLSPLRWGVFWTDRDSGRQAARSPLFACFHVEHQELTAI